MGNPLINVDPLGLEILRRPPPSYLTDTPIDACLNTGCIKITFESGYCQPGDTQCVMAMTAAGLQPPFVKTVETRSYSLTCLLTLGLFGKVGGVKAGNYIPGKAPGLAAKIGFGEVGVAVVGRGAAIYSNPMTTAAVAPFAARSLAQHCECNH